MGIIIREINDILTAWDEGLAHSGLLANGLAVPEALKALSNFLTALGSTVAQTREPDIRIPIAEAQTKSELEV